MRIFGVICALGLLVAMPREVAAQNAQISDKADTAIGAATAFSVGYGVWLWEKKCRKLPADEFAAYKAAVTGQMQRLSAMLDLSLFQAILGTGQDTAKDTDATPSCSAEDALDFAKFGVEMIKDSGEKIATLPADYHLTITN